MVCFSPFGLGVRIPRKARERAGRTKALWRVCRRIICTGRSECQTASGSRSSAQGPPCRPRLDTPREYTIRYPPEPCPGRWAGAILRRPAAPDNPGHWLRRTVRAVGPRPEEKPGTAGDSRRRKADPGHRCPSRIWLSIQVSFRIKPASMDAKQVWRAALGELQVSLSPANFETWLRDTGARRRRRQPVQDRRAQRLRQGLAGDALPLADLPDAGPHRGLQRPGRVHGPAGRREARHQRRGAATTPAVAAPQQVRLEATRVGAPEGAVHQPQPALHLRQLHRRLGQPARPRRQPVGRRAARATPTTRSSCTAAWAWARRT